MQNSNGGIHNNALLSIAEFYIVRIKLTRNIKCLRLLVNSFPSACSISMTFVPVAVMIIWQLNQCSTSSYCDCNEYFSSAGTKFVCFFKCRATGSREATSCMNIDWCEVIYISCVTDLFWQHYSVYPLHWKSSQACPFAGSLDSWPAMNCVLKDVKERVNEVKINEAREHHRLKAVSSTMPHL